MAAQPLPRMAEAPLDFGAAARVKAALIVIAFFAAFWSLLSFVPPIYGTLVNGWLSSSDWSHGPIIPFFSAYLVVQRWDQIRKTPVAFAWLGVPIIVFGLALYAFTVFGVVTFAFLRQIGMMVTLFGVVTTLLGVYIWRHAWVPYLYLFFAIPIPQEYYFKLTHPLRELAASIAYALLSLLPNLSIERSESLIQYTLGTVTGQIVVADACSGMRSLIVLCALGVAVAFVSDRPIWQRIILLASCIPIAIFCNMLRVIATCLIHIYIGPEYASGNYHMMLGLVVLGLALALFVALGWVLDHLVVEDDGGDDPDGAATDGGPGVSSA